MLKVRSTWLLGVLSAALVNCGGGEMTPEPETPEPPPPVAAEPETAETAEPVTEAPAEAPAEAPKPEPLTDEQILSILEAANTSEIDLAKLAQKKAKDAKVKKFAGMMVADHNSAKGKQKKIVAKHKLTPADHAMATSITDQTASALESLKAATGPDFDKAYMDGQVDMHKKLLDSIDMQMMADAKNEDLKKLLDEIRPKVEAHLKQAQEIQGALAAAPAAAEPAAKGGGAK